MNCPPPQKDEPGEMPGNILSLVEKGLQRYEGLAGLTPNPKNEKIMDELIDSALQKDAGAQTGEGDRHFETSGDWEPLSKEKEIEKLEKLEKASKMKEEAEEKLEEAKRAEEKIEKEQNKINNKKVKKVMKSKAKGEAETSSVGIPKKIYQSWISKETMPEGMRENVDKWPKVNPDYEVRFFNDKEQEEWMKTECNDYFQPWKACELPAGRADIFRYCLLFTYGGVWVDIDMIPYIPLKRVLSKDVRATVLHDGGMSAEATSERGYLYNAFMASVPRDPIFKRALDIVLEHFMTGVRTRAIDSTGPGVLWRAVKETVGIKPSSYWGVEELTKNKDSVQYMNFDGDNIMWCQKRVDDQPAKSCIAMNGKYEEYLDDVKKGGGEPHYGREVVFNPDNLKL